ETGVLRRGPQRLPFLVPYRKLRAPRHEHRAAQTPLGAVADLVGRRARVVIGQTAEPEEARGLSAVEGGDVVVVRAVDRGERLVIGDAAVGEEAARDADDAVDDLGLDAVALLVLAPLHRIRRPRLRA